MGNCIDRPFSPPHKKVKIITLDGRKEEFNASMSIKDITSGPYQGYKIVHHSQPKQPLPPDAMLWPGEVYYLIPPLAQYHDHSPPEAQRIMANDRDWSRKRVKIMLTKQRLEMLVRNDQKVQSVQEVVQTVCVGEGCQKWRPSLDTIHELENC